MGYFILLLIIIVYIIRPAEWIPALRFNWNFLLNSLAILVIGAMTLDQKRKLSYDRITLFLLWFFFSMIVSNLVRGQIGVIGTYFLQMVTNISVFVLLQASVTSEKQIRRLILIIALLLVFVCYQCHLQLTQGENWGGLKPLYRNDGATDDSFGNIVGEKQPIWYGILSDPNDLGMILIAFVPYIFNRIFFQSISLLARINWLGIMLVLIYSVILTQSRGSLLALVAAFGSFFMIKQRSLAGMVFSGVSGVVLLTLGGSRMSSVTSGDESAMGRVDAWILALQLFAQNPISGIGANRFNVYHAYTTHNSYVLALVETGLLGFVVYMSMFIVSLNTAIRVALKEANNQISTEIIALAAGLIGIAISVFFISRTYVLLPMLYISILVTYVRIQSPTLFAEEIHSLKLKALIFFSILFIIFLYIFNRLATSLLL
ncbi:MAG: O-antigen ligase [Gammaproteobacteria bacterium]|jgi:O-antigen ligase